jgi:hypothetical protein
VLMGEPVHERPEPDALHDAFHSNRGSYRDGNHAAF